MHQYLRTTKQLRPTWLNEVIQTSAGTELLPLAADC